MSVLLPAASGRNRAGYHRIAGVTGPTLADRADSPSAVTSMFAVT
jgi:hypothetical protein